MINLNSINLGSINLGGMNTSEIKLGYPSSGCPVPGLKGLQGFYMGKGLTNEMMSRDPVWRDKSGKGNHIQLKNFGWKLDSGCGKYSQDFKLWNSNNLQFWTISRVGERVEYIYQMPGTRGSVPGYFVASNWNNVKTNIKAGDKGLRLYLKYPEGSMPFLELNPNEIGIIPQLSDEELVNLKHIFCGPATEVKAGEVFSFEQIPDYDGAICFDGVDDYGICETFPILTKEKGYTVMALRKWISREKQFESLVSNVDSWRANQGAFIVEYRNNIDMTSSFGWATSVNLAPVLMYQTSTNYNGRTIRTGDYLSTNVFLVGKTAKTILEYYSNFAIYALAIFDHDTTEEERQPVIDYWKKEFPELFPDQAWTVTGKTNSDADRATIKNITGNGNNLVLTNFGFAENSGYGKWPVKINTTAAIFKDQPYGTARFTVDIYAQTINRDINFIHFKFRVRGLEEGKTFTIRCTTPDVVQILKEFSVTENGIYEFEYENADILFNVLFYNGLGDENKRGDYYVDILQDPDYEGYLLTDGVDDGIVSSPFDLSENWTMVGDWKMLDNATLSPVFLKSGSFVFEYRDALFYVYIKNPETAKVINGVNSIKAICSDGRLYLHDGTEIIDDNLKTYKGGISPIYIGRTKGGTKLSKIAFKNLAIYNNTILTKDQCIRAYNYLQTIKNN